MILSKVINNQQDIEQNPVYKKLENDNLIRQYDFLRSIVDASLHVEPHPKLSSTLIKALNYHAIACLHSHAGEYRPCPVRVGNYQPPDHNQVPQKMKDFINKVNSSWNTADPYVLASYCLWGLNHIHPFVNGNGRTSRVLCYFVICIKAGGWLPGSPILPHLIRQNRDEYVKLLKAADDAYKNNRYDGLRDLHEFISKLLKQQINSV